MAPTKEKQNTTNKDDCINDVSTGVKDEEMKSTVSDTDEKVSTSCSFADEFNDGIFNTTTTTSKEY
eukprot:11176248-Ditylum_brightwellii.AAC.1